MDNAKYFEGRKFGVFSGGVVVLPTTILIVNSSAQPLQKQDLDLDALPEHWRRLGRLYRVEMSGILWLRKERSSRSITIFHGDPLAESGGEDITFVDNATANEFWLAMKERLGGAFSETMEPMSRTQSVVAPLVLTVALATVIVRQLSVNAIPARADELLGVVFVGAAFVASVAWTVRRLRHGAEIVTLRRT